MRSEFEHAREFANKVLDKPHRDPDDDLSVLARQFLRAIESVDLKPLSENMTAPDFAAMARQAAIDGLALQETKEEAWRPISEAPQDGTQVLLGYFLEGGGGGCPEVGFWHSSKKKWCSRVLLNAEGYFSPTHWQPLPPPPAAALPNPEASKEK